MSFVCSKAEGFQAAARGLMDSLSSLNSRVVGWAGILFGRRAAAGGGRHLQLLLSATSFTSNQYVY